jgi:hypothetical protein
MPVAEHRGTQPEETRDKRAAISAPRRILILNQAFYPDVAATAQQAADSAAAESAHAATDARAGLAKLSGIANPNPDAVSQNFATSAAELKAKAQAQYQQLSRALHSTLAPKSSPGAKRPV